MAGTFTAYGDKGYNTGTQHITGSNSLVIEVGDLITATSGFGTKTAAGGAILGVSHTDATFASDNQTVAKARIIYAPVSAQETYTVPADGTLTEAMVGQFFDINADQEIDVSTASATTGQLQLVEFVTASRGIVKIVNA